MSTSAAPSRAPITRIFLGESFQSESSTGRRYGTMRYLFLPVAGRLPKPDEDDGRAPRGFEDGLPHAHPSARARAKLRGIFQEMSPYDRVIELTNIVLHGQLVTIDSVHGVGKGWEIHLRKNSVDDSLCNRLKGEICAAVSQAFPGSPVDVIFA